MRRFLSILTVALAVSVFARTAQQGGAGQGIYEGGSVVGLERAVNGYLTGDEIRSVLTPGEFVEWKLDLKAGQVVIAEARSDAFDPALEIVDEKNKVLGFNDDRYPGDQRPLLLWRCERDGVYLLHVRSFHDKFGGQFFVRFKTYNCVDLLPGQTTEKELDGSEPFLLRIPMKAGEIKEILCDLSDRFARFEVRQFIAPDGLPDINLAHQIQSVTSSSTLLAPVSGDYYAYAIGLGRDRVSKIRGWTRDMSPEKLTQLGQIKEGSAKTNQPALWQLTVKAGELIEASTPDLSLHCRIVLAEQPDLSKFDMAKSETNPFFPLTALPKDNGPAIEEFPARARDQRSKVFFARRDANLWIASNGDSPADKQFTIRVRPAAQQFVESTPNVGKLRTGNTDYWVFDAKAGDVMTLQASTSDFSQVLTVHDPDMYVTRRFEAAPDQTSDDWRMVIEKPGRYVEAVSCLGNGGAGQYQLMRKVIHPKEFGISAAARSGINIGEIQVWRFRVTPDIPLLIRWNSTNWSYDVAIYDEKGQRTDFQKEQVDDHNRFGILRVTEPRSFIIVLTGGHDRATYSIELNPIPGYKKE